MILMDGKKLAEEKFDSLQDKLKEGNLSLAVVQVGDNEASNSYVNVKKRELEKRGIRVSVYKFNNDESEDDIINKIKLAEEDGVIVQLPLIENLNKEKILNSIPTEKDVDLLSVASCGKLYKGESITISPVVGAVKALLEEYGISIKGKRVAIIGAGELVGKPLLLFFVKEGATVSVANKETDDIGFFTKNAKIIVSGTGVPGLIKEEMVEKDSIVIDAGTGSENGIIKGDVDRSAVMMKTGLFSPVPGGVGPLTVYYVAENLLKLKNLQNGDR